MSVLVILGLIITVLCGFSNAANAKALYLCERDNFRITGIVVSFDGSPSHPAVAFVPGKRGTCSSDGGSPLIHGNGTQSNPYTASIKYVDDATKCNITAQGHLRTVTILVTRYASISRNSDYSFSFTCDPNRPMEQIAYAGNGLSVSGDPRVDNTSLESSEEFTLQVIDAITGQPFTGPVPLSTRAKLRFTIKDPTKSVKECRITNCEASKKNSFRGNSRVLLENSCTTTTDNIFLTRKGYFAKGLTTTGSLLSLSYNLNIDFGIFRFRKSNYVYYRCTCYGCITSGDADCSEPTCPPPSGRKRREVPGYNQTKLEAVARIYVVDPEPTPNPVEAEKLCLGVCVNNATFIAVAILSLLLLISLAVCVKCCTVMIRRRKLASKKPTDSKISA